MTDQSPPSELANRLNGTANAVSVDQTDPIEGYNEAVRDEYEELRLEASDNATPETFAIINDAGWHVINSLAHDPPNGRERVTILVRTEPPSEFVE
jgi:hypothetical protein